MLEGNIALLNRTRAMYAVKLSDGTYSVFEMSDSTEINLGDVISGPLDEEGDCTLNNVTEDEEFDAIVQNAGLNLKDANIRILRN
ncbi:hypothetical protein KXD93_16735 [Mucilaginibacter sp. BJC16-A38]|uniref:hypothetical protein n=1 Tax=Mucilaginibacter phenanthrenivorans TaxID=1234842 RepID=UPI00215706E1|nr:hypothetical protein [Mucilaginibacter phenanthrenivorans]MCR8559306.1 hypothetical protein [Mucilaginibacter phenanthrenivorans]